VSFWDTCLSLSPDDCKYTIFTDKLMTFTGYLYSWWASEGLLEEHADDE